MYFIVTIISYTILLYAKKKNLWNSIANTVFKYKH